MSTGVLNPAPIMPACVYVRLKHETNLAAMTQEVASLRFSIVLLARLDESRTVAKRDLAELRTELADLRKLYFDKIDEIAMTFGVQQAMDTKAEVERSVFVPEGIVPQLHSHESEQLRH